MIAIYFARALENKNLFLERIENKNSYEGKILLWFLANESLQFKNASVPEQRYLEEHVPKFSSLKDRYEHIEKQDFLLQRLATRTIDSELFPYAEYFEDYDSFIFLKPAGESRLEKDWPEMFADLKRTVE